MSVVFFIRSTRSYKFSVRSLPHLLHSPSSYWRMLDLVLARLTWGYCFFRSVFVPLLLDALRVAYSHRSNPDLIDESIGFDESIYLGVICQID